MHQVARNECSMRELVDIHNRELMARIFDTVNKAPDRPPAVLGGEGLYECPRAGIAALAGWQLEHIRAFAVELSELAVVLKDVCTPSACPQMKATDEWMYLCAAHKQPQVRGQDIFRPVRSPLRARSLAPARSRSRPPRIQTYTHTIEHRSAALSTT